MFRQRASYLFVVGFLSVADLLSPAAVAQQLLPDSSHSLPSDADLDALLAARNWNALESSLIRVSNADDAGRRVNWLLTRLVKGGGLFVASNFARNLWLIGADLKLQDPANDPRVSAGLISLYAYELIVIDGSKCEDQSAPVNWISRFLTSHANIFAFLKQQPQAVKLKLVDGAIAIERNAAPLRKDDELICRGGIQEMRAGLERGARHQVPTAAGQIGKTVEVTAPLDWTPKFLSPDAYGPVQDRARAGMRENLLKLMEQPS